MIYVVRHLPCLGWDQATHMPEGGAAARGRQLSTLETASAPEGDRRRISATCWMSVEKSQRPDLIGHRLRHSFASPGTGLREGQQSARRFRRACKRATVSESYAAWTKARAENNFAAMVPHLRRNCRNQSRLRRVFRALRERRRSTY